MFARLLIGTGLGALLATGAGCLSPQAVRVPGNSSWQESSWHGEHKVDDDLWTYQVGNGQGKTVQDARNRAYEDALAAIAKSIQSEVKVQGGRIQIAADLVVRNAEIMPLCVYMERLWGRYRCLLQVAYPLSEKRKILKRIALGDELNRDWNSALTAFQKGEWSLVVSLTHKISLSLGDEPLGLRFRACDARLLSAQSLAKCHRIEETVALCNNLMQQTVCPDIRDKATKLLNGLVNDWTNAVLDKVFSGKQVAIFTACKVHESVSVWDPPKSGIATLVQERRGEVVVLGEKAEWGPEQIIEATKNDAGCVKLAGRVPAAMVIQFALEGAINTRTNAKAVQGKDYQFEGMARVAVVKVGVVMYSSRYFLKSGWNPVNEELCRDVVAGHVLSRWKEEFVEGNGGARPILPPRGE